MTNDGSGDPPFSSVGSPAGGRFSPDVERALRAALAAHDGQLRKGDPVAYIVHPMHVALLLARYGSDDETLQAALLHDVVEDCKGWTVERVLAEFGPVVAEVVEDLTEEAGGSWEVRKEAALMRVDRMGPRALAVKAADKLHNVESLLARLESTPDADSVWRAFSRGPGPSIEYAAKLSDRLRMRLGEVGQFEALGEELHAAVVRLRRFLPMG